MAVPAVRFPDPQCVATIPPRRSHLAIICAWAAHPFLPASGPTAGTVMAGKRK